MYTANLLENIYLNGKCYSAHVSECYVTLDSTLKIPLGSLFWKAWVSALMGLSRRIFAMQSMDMSDSLDLKNLKNNALGVAGHGQVSLLNQGCQWGGWHRSVLLFSNPRSLRLRRTQALSSLSHAKVPDLVKPGNFIIAQGLIWEWRALRANGPAMLQKNKK